MADVTDPLQKLRQDSDGAKQSTADACYDWIKRQIVTNARPPGAALDERNLAEELNVSRTPVREAMLRLRSEGFIDNLPRRGAFVRALTLEDLSDLYDVVTAVEVMAVGLIAESDDRAQIVAELNRLCDNMEAALEDPELWTHSDEAFHRALLELSGNAPLASTGLLHRDLAQRAHFVADRARPKGTEIKSVEAHRALVDLIATGNAEAARANHLKQRQRGSQSLIAAIRFLGLRSL
jgi:DNA-binding GntR family transcriptional regulator